MWLSRAARDFPACPRDPKIQPSSRGASVWTDETGRRRGLPGSIQPGRGRMAGGLEPGGMLREMQETAQCHGMERSRGIKEELQGSKGAFCPRVKVAGG